MTKSGADAFIQGLCNLKDLPLNAKVILCPPFPLIQSCLGYSSFEIGAQTSAAFLEGPYTGEVSATLLKEMGCRYVIVGHSERRLSFGETNAIVRQKSQKVLEEGLVPIICVGEPWDAYKSGKAYTYLQEQLEESLPENGSFLVAYEPIWAIGTGEIPALGAIEDTHQFLKGFLPMHTPVIYGGSVTGENAKDILALPSVSGVLVGGASLSLETFLPIIRSVR